MLALTGPLFAVIFAVAVFAFSPGDPGEGASAQAVLDNFHDHKADLAIGAFGGPLLAALIVLFFSYVRSAARDRAASSGAGPTVMVGGAVLWAAGLLLGSTLNLAALSAEDHHLGQVAQTINVLNAVCWIPFIGGIAVTLIGAGMTVLRSGLLPGWLGWLALVVGIVALAGPGGFLGFFAAPLWMLVGGIMLFSGSDEPATV
jgi:hypothetical protein